MSMVPPFSQSSSSSVSVSLPFGRLPSSWLCFIFRHLDLESLLRVGSVNQTWNRAQQRTEAWATRKMDWETGRCFQPTTYQQLKHGVPKRLEAHLQNMALDIEELLMADEEEEGEDEEETVNDDTNPGDDGGDSGEEVNLIEDEPLPVAFEPNLIQFDPIFPTLFHQFPSLTSLSVHDIQNLLDDDELLFLVRSCHRLKAFSIRREVTTTEMMRAILEPTLVGENERAVECQVQCLQLMYMAGDRSCFQRVTDEYLVPLSFNQTVQYDWPLVHSLVSLSITLNHPDTILPLTHIPLEELDLKIETDLASFNGEDHLLWRCFFQRHFVQPTHSSSSMTQPSLWCHSLRRFHLTVTNLHDSILYAISHLVELTELGLLNEYGEDDPGARSLPPVRRNNWSQAIESELVGKHDKMPLTPMGLYALRRLTKLTRLEVNLKQGWILQLVPFLRPDAITSSEDTRSDVPVPLAFWSSFPSLFCFKHHSANRFDMPCLSSLDSQIDTVALDHAICRLLPNEDDVLLQQDLLLYALAACDGLRSLHLCLSMFSSYAMETFVNRIILASIESQLSNKLVRPLIHNDDVNPTSSASVYCQDSSNRLIPLFDACFFSLPEKVNVDRIASLVSNYFASIQYLHFIHCSSFTDAGLQHILRACVHLHTLDIRRCHRLTAAGLSQIGRAIPLLHSLNLSELDTATNEVVIDIITHTPNLHSLHLKQTPTTSGVLLPVIQRTINLLCLNVAKNGDNWLEEDLEAYKQSRPYPMQMITDYEETGEK